MPPRDWVFRIQDILDAIAKIRRYVSDIDFETFENDEEVMDAVVHRGSRDRRRLKKTVWERSDSRLSAARFKCYKLPPSLDMDVSGVERSFHFYFHFLPKPATSGNKTGKIFPHYFHFVEDSRHSFEVLRLGSESLARRDREYPSRR